MRIDLRARPIAARIHPHLRAQTKMTDREDHGGQAKSRINCDYIPNYLGGKSRIEGYLSLI